MADNWKPSVREFEEWVRSSAIPVRRIAEPRVREQLRRASIIFGYDTASGYRAVFFGLKVLELGVRRGWTTRQAVISFAYDSRTDEFEYLIAAVQVLKGSCDIDAARVRP